MQHIYRHWLHWGLISALQHTTLSTKITCLAFHRNIQLKPIKSNNKCKNWQIRTIWNFLCLKVLYHTLHRFIKTQTYSGLELSDMIKCDSSWRKTQIIGTSIMTACDNTFSALVWNKVYNWAFRYTLHTFPSIGEMTKDTHFYFVQSSFHPSHLHESNSGIVDATQNCSQY